MATVTLHGNAFETNGNLPEVGSKAPGFQLVDSDLKDVSLADFAGKSVILNIFPSIDTEVCATSTRRFNEEAQELAGVKVLTVSKDLPFALKRFRANEGLDKILQVSAFRSAEFGDAYGVKLVNGPLGELFARAIVVVNGDGEVVHTELVPEIGDEPNYDAAIAAVR